MTAAAALISDELPSLQKLRLAVEGALEGKQDAVELSRVALLARGHLLIEDVPGVGKTTLLRLLLGQLMPQSGTVLLGTQLAVVYFDQLRVQLDVENTIWENIVAGNYVFTIDGKL